ncbi:hypothetical protein [Kribbella sp. NBC_00889]|nr:hypothetical protein OG817_11480 [Kribbella sp. NBC_00889]
MSSTRAFGNLSTAGTISMFEREGFTAEKLIGDAYVLMRRQL